MGVHKRTELTAKQVKAAYMYAIELKSFNDISAELGVSRQSLWKWKNDPRWQKEVDRILKEEWREACKSLQKKMIKKAEDGEFKALEYVLNSNGYKAPEVVEVAQKTISVSITDDEDTEEDE